MADGFCSTPPRKARRLDPDTPEVCTPEGLKKFPPSAQRRWHLSTLARLTAQGSKSSSSCSKPAPEICNSTAETIASPVPQSVASLVTLLSQTFNLVPVPPGVLHHLAQILMQAAGRMNSRFEVFRTVLTKFIFLKFFME